MKTEILDNGILRVSVPVRFTIQGGKKRIAAKNLKALRGYNSTLVSSIARGFYWQSLVDEGKYENYKALAEELNLDPLRVAKTCRLTLLSPKIVHKIIIGELSLSVERLRRHIPILWKDQEELFLGQKE